ncbi:MAG TPA: Ppx/GppA phosphatase family protein [Anaerolineales bacterium]|nr:Ppx/GppA phosphatase family protein [Anaerolineales bacterium]
MQTIAAIDVGSNAIRMVVGRVNSTDEVDAIDNTRIPVRLGQDVFSIGHIGEPSMQATLDAFLRFRQIADQFEAQQIRAVATSAMREAENSDLLVDRIVRQTGIQVEIISGEEEARLIHLAVGKAINLEHKKAVLIDIGGGSIEVAISRGTKLISTESYDMGTVRLLHNLDDGVQRSFRVLLREYTAAVRRRIQRELGKIKLDLCIGTGGNIEEMGSLRKKIFKRDTDHLITVSELEMLSEKLSKLTVNQRIKKLNLRPDRADVILPATMMLHMISLETHIKEIQIPGVGLKDGVLWDMMPLTLGSHLPRREQIWTSATHLGHKYQFDGEHGVRVAKTSQSIFDQTSALHNLGEGDRLLLEVASLLHDIGHFIDTLNHDKHGYYILKNSPLIGLEQRQQDVVANIIWYHRNTPLTNQDEHFKALTQKDRLLVTKLCALLRLADAVEVSHTARIREVKMKKIKRGWNLKMIGEGNFLLERWALEKRKTLFEEVFGTRLEILE